MLIRKRLLVTGASATAWSSLWLGSPRAATPIEVLSADVRPLSIADGPRRGLVLDIVDEALRGLGYEPRFTFLPFADALSRTQAEPNRLMAPVARSPQREALFAWIAEIIAVPQAMGTLANRPAVDLEGARQLRRIGIVGAGVQESFLRERGFENLVAYPTARAIAQALNDGQLDAWYSTATEIAMQFEAIGKAELVRVGPTIQTAPVWLAGNLATGALPITDLARAVADLKQSGAIERIYRSYVPG